MHPKEEKKTLRLNPVRISTAIKQLGSEPHEHKVEKLAPDYMVESIMLEASCSSVINYRLLRGRSLELYLKIIFLLLRFKLNVLTIN